MMRSLRNAVGPTGGMRRRLMAWAGGSSVGVVAMLVLLAPSAGATTVVSFSAPYTTFVASPSSSTSTYGCTTAHNGGLPTWSNSTGTFNMVAHATLSGCSGYNDAYAEGFVSLTSPTFSFPRGGTAYLTTKISAAWSARAVLAGTTSSGLYNTSFVEVSVTATAYLIDATTGGIVSGSGSSFSVSIVALSTSTAGTSVSASTSTPFTIFAYGPVHGTHSYEMEVYFSGSVDVYSASGATGAASLNLGGTNGVTLTSISIA